MERINDDEDAFHVSLFNNNLPGSVERWDNELRAVRDDVTIASEYSNGWGSFTMIKATLDAIQHYRDQPYDYFINLSGQCYPLRTVPEIKAVLNEGGGKGYLECNPLPWDRWDDEDGGFDRVHRMWFKPFKSLDKISVPRLSKTLPLDMRPYGGSQWFCLPKAQAEHVLDMVEAHPEIASFFKRSLIPDEMFFQTILMNSPYRDEINVKDNLRYVDWSKRCVPLPAVLLSEDLDRLLNSGKLFARKFDPEMDGAVLDQLDRHLGHRPV